MTDPDLVLHVGMPRSGFVLRAALSELRPQLRARGVAFIGDSDLDRLRHLHGWDCDPWVRARAAAAFERELGARVAAEKRRATRLRAGRPVPVVISSDRLLGGGDIGPSDADRFRPYAVRAMSQVVGALSARRVQVVLYTHRQDRLMELSHLQRIRAGSRASFADCFPHRFEPVLDYRDLVDRLRTVPHVSDVVVRPVELADAGAHAFVNDFLGLFGLADTLDLSAIPAKLSPHPPVYSARGVQLALAMNAVVETADELGWVRSYLTDNHPAGDTGTTDLLDPATRQRILDCYAPSNRELFAEHLPDLPPDSYCDDTATFDLGNVLRQPRPAVHRPTRRAADATVRRGRRLCRRGRRWAARRLRQRG